MNTSPFRQLRWRLIALIAASLCAHAAAAASPRAVVELFTSQGCSSCPPADALVGRLASDSNILVLSFHVNYWDDLGWKDSFSSAESTDRQYAYGRSLGERSVFTPQLIVNGTQSLVGSQEYAVRRAVAAAGESSFPVHATLSRQSDGSFTAALDGPNVSGEVWEVRYVRRAVTKVHAGENGGRSLETFNNVTRLRRLGSFRPGTITLPALQAPDDGLAVFVQAPSAGRMLGAAVY